MPYVIDVVQNRDPQKDSNLRSLKVNPTPICAKACRLYRISSYPFELWQSITFTGRHLNHCSTARTNAGRHGYITTGLDLLKQAWEELLFPHDPLRDFWFRMTSLGTWFTMGYTLLSIFLGFSRAYCWFSGVVLFGDGNRLMDRHRQPIGAYTKAEGNTDQNSWILVTSFCSA